MLDLSKSGALNEPGSGIIAPGYIEIDIGEGFFEKILEEYEPVGVTSPSIPCLKDCSIIPTDNGMIAKWPEDIFHSSLKERQEEL